MTPISDTFAVDINAKLDRELMNLILEKGQSRVPVYYEQPTNIIGLVLLPKMLLVQQQHLILRVTMVVDRPIMRIFVVTLFGVHGQIHHVTEVFYFSFEAISYGIASAIALRTIDALTSSRCTGGHEIAQQKKEKEKTSSAASASPNPKPPPAAAAGGNVSTTTADTSKGAKETAASASPKLLLLLALIWKIQLLMSLHLPSLVIHHLLMVPKMFYCVNAFELLVSPYWNLGVMPVHIRLNWSHLQ